MFYVFINLIIKLLEIIQKLKQFYNKNQKIKENLLKIAKNTKIFYAIHERTCNFMQEIHVMKS